jgi:MFS family permease
MPFRGVRVTDWKVGPPDLEERDFQRFLVTRFFGASANQMLMVAVGWQMYDLTGSAWNLGLVGLFQFIPALLLTLPAGYLVDKYDRRYLLSTALMLQSLACIFLAVATAGHWVNRDLILGVCLIIGMAKAIQMPSTQALLPSLLPYHRLTRALSQNSAINKMAVVGAPALGGLVYAYSALGLYGLCTTILLIAFYCTISIRPLPRHDTTTVMDLSSLFAGFRFIWNHKIVLGACSLDLFATLLGSATALLPILAKDVLHTGPWGVGLLRAAMAVGGLSVAIAMTRYPIERRVGFRMFVAVAIYGIGMIILSRSTTLVLSCLALAISGAADTISVVLRQSLIQLETSDSMRGRVSAANSTFVGASNQLGEFRAGVTAEWLGATSALFAGAIGTMMVVAIWTRLFPDLARRDAMVEQSGIP